MLTTVEARHRITNRSKVEELAKKFDLPKMEHAHMKEGSVLLMLDGTFRKVHKVATGYILVDLVTKERLNLLHSTLTGIVDWYFDLIKNSVKMRFENELVAFRKAQELLSKCYIANPEHVHFY